MLPRRRDFRVFFAFFLRALRSRASLAASSSAALLPPPPASSSTITWSRLPAAGRTSPPAPPAPPLRAPPCRPRPAARRGGDLSPACRAPRRWPPAPPRARVGLDISHVFRLSTRYTSLATPTCAVTLHFVHASGMARVTRQTNNQSPRRIRGLNNSNRRLERIYTQNYSDGLCDQSSDVSCPRCRRLPARVSENGKLARTAPGRSTVLVTASTNKLNDAKKLVYGDSTHHLGTNTAVSGQTNSGGLGGSAEKFTAKRLWNTA